MFAVSMATRQDDQVGAKQAKERGQHWYHILLTVSELSAKILMREGRVLLTQGGKDYLVSLSLSRKDSTWKSFCSRWWRWSSTPPLKQSMTCHVNRLSASHLVALLMYVSGSQSPDGG